MGSMVDRGVLFEAVRNDGGAPHFVNAALPGASGSSVPNPISFVMLWHGRTGVLAPMSWEMWAPWFEPIILKTVAGVDDRLVSGLRGLYGCGTYTTSQPCGTSQDARGNGWRVHLKRWSVQLGRCLPSSEDKWRERGPVCRASRCRGAWVMLAVSRCRAGVDWVLGLRWVGWDRSVAGEMVSVGGEAQV